MLYPTDELLEEYIMKCKSNDFWTLRDIMDFISTNLCYHSSIPVLFFVVLKRAHSFFTGTCNTPCAPYGVVA